MLCIEITVMMLNGSVTCKCIQYTFKYWLLLVVTQNTAVFTLLLLNYTIICFLLLIDTVDTKGNSAGQHTPFEFVDPSDLDCSLCMRYLLFSRGCL